MDKAVVVALIDAARKLRDYHDEHCEHEGACPDSIEADIAIKAACEAVGNNG